MSAGDYIIFIKADWTDIQKERKLITNLYYPGEIPIVRESSKGEYKDYFKSLQNPLNNKLNNKATYKLPAYALV